MEHDQIPPLGWLQSIIGGLLAMLIGTWVWLFKRFDKRVIEVEKTQKEEALKVQLQLTELASRKDLIAHVMQIREDLVDRDNRNRIDGDRRHIENREWLEKLDENVSNLRAENRDDIRAVHLRIDALK